MKSNQLVIGILIGAAIVVGLWIAGARLVKVLLPFAEFEIAPSNVNIQPTATAIKETVMVEINCSIGSPLPHHTPIVGQAWVLPNGGWIIVNFWSNSPGIDQTEHKILLGPNSPRSFVGGGSAWQWADECEATARVNLKSNPLPEITLEELQSLGLVR